MAREVTVAVGSGLTPGINGLGVNAVTQERNLVGTAVVVINPEDNAVAGPLRADQLSVGTTASKLPPPGSGHLDHRREIRIHNLGGDTLFIGQSGVTVNDGFPVTSGNSIALEAKTVVDLWGVSDGSADIRMLQLSQA